MASSAFSGAARRRMAWSIASSGALSLSSNRSYSVQVGHSHAMMPWDPRGTVVQPSR